MKHDAGLEYLCPAELSQDERALPTSHTAAACVVLEL